MSAEPVGESTGEVRPLRISPELARELLRVLREEDLELPEDSTVLAVIVEPPNASTPPAHPRYSYWKLSPVDARAAVGHTKGVGTPWKTARLPAELLR
jgi:hypothetical protein